MAASQEEEAGLRQQQGMDGRIQFENGNFEELFFDSSSEDDFEGFDQNENFDDVDPVANGKIWQLTQSPYRSCDNNKSVCKHGARG